MLAVREALAAGQPWKVRAEACARAAAEARAADVPELLPLLAPMLFDAKAAVKEAAQAAVERLCATIDNRDVAPLIPRLIAAMADPCLVEECVHALAATTFVQSMAADTLALIVPLLTRALTLRVKAIQRKACVIIENMAKLVDCPADVAVFLPSLVPLVEYVAAHAADPDNRGVAERTLATLRRVLASAGGTGAQASAADEAAELLCDCTFSLAYGAKILLKNATLKLHRGFRYGVCAPNGAGKTTLLRAIHNGQVDGFPPPEVLKTIYVELDTEGAAHLTAAEYAAGAGAADGALADYGFDVAMQSALVGSLSGGWIMKLVLARAMAQRPDILLLDEPTNHLDVAHVAWLEDYLTRRAPHVSCIIVSHDAAFMDRVCTHTLVYRDFKIHLYKGGLTSVPEAAVADDAPPFKFPAPGFLEGVKTKDKAILKAHGACYRYPGAAAEAADVLTDVTLNCNLCSRIAVVGPNGAGKSTLIKLLMGETEPTAGAIWRHPNLRIAYVAQHAFHHLEEHLDKTPMQYMQWRYATGEDREKQALAVHQLSPEEEAAVASKFLYNGQKRVIEAIVSRRKAKKSYEYEVQWQGYDETHNAWFERQELEAMGFAKRVQEMDQKEAARLGVVTRPLTAAQVCAQMEDLGLEAEITLHARMSGLSGGQKVKVVIGAAMWLNPHLLIMDEPTNFLDRESLAALGGAIREYGGGVILVTHHHEFSAALCTERWRVGGGRVDVEGGNGAGAKTGTAAAGPIVAETETVDAFGNVIHIKAKKTAKERKKAAKARQARLDRGEVVTSEEED